MRWWGVCIACNQCNGPTNPMAVLFRADGMFKILLHCEACNLHMYWDVSGSDLMEYAKNSDAASTVPVTDFAFTEEDKKWMSHFHIKDPA